MTRKTSMIRKKLPLPKTRPQNCSTKRNSVSWTIYWFWREWGTLCPRWTWLSWCKLSGHQIILNTSSLLRGSARTFSLPGLNYQSPKRQSKMKKTAKYSHAQILRAKNLINLCMVSSQVPTVRYSKKNTGIMLISGVVIVLKKTRSRIRKKGKVTDKINADVMAASCLKWLKQRLDFMDNI